ncbi:MAG TPA: double-strand break repair protein AddB [Xanthobacteraceae bacterium]|nr:double-strand break repair protein AddB [Xanthobacteraceae bacterium]
MARPVPRVFTIPPSAPFLPTLIAALMEGRLVPGFPHGEDPLALSRATLYLPTRRAVVAAREAFLDVLGRDGAVLPRLVAIGDIDEDELIFAEAGRAEALDLPPPLAPLERRLLLARLVLEWSRSPAVRGAGATPLVAHTPAAALGLADALARLIDDMITRKVAWEKLDRLVPHDLDPYWQLTLAFLKVARETWPAVLAASGAMEPAARRDALIAAEAKRLAAAPDAPVVAAGSTASMPSTAALLAAIARLPHGAVVLPGLDRHLDAPSWALIAGEKGRSGAPGNPAASHPQFAMQAFLAALDIRREEVEPLGGATVTPREKLVSEAMRPAAASEHWQQRFPESELASALEKVALIEAGNAEEEALAIAVALREAVHENRSAALITPDRALARRVLLALERWRISADDSAGEPLADAAAGVFARLAAEAALSGLAPVALLALLKHPYFRLGGRENAHAQAISALERALLRGPRPRPGSEGLAAALAAFRASREALRRDDPRRWIGEAALEAAEALVAGLRAALAPLEALADAPLPLAELAARHHAVVTALAHAGRGSSALAGADGAALSATLDAIATSEGARVLAVAPRDYPEVLERVFADRVVRRAGAPDTRVRIFGLLEARLQRADRVVLGGLIEGVWPPQTRCDPWLSRPMRLELGLDLPERRIGLTAHDFAQLLGAPEVILSRAAKLGGAPTVASRFLQRLAAVCGRDRWSAVRARGDRYIAWARALDRAPRQPPLPAPTPRPPLAVRPKQLSVTEIEHWLRDPYTIYAKRILKLVPLDPVDTPPGARDRGTAIHAAIAEFTERYADALPDDPEAALLAIGERHFAPLAAYPEARAFWWPRFTRIARWFAAWERRRRTGIAAIHAEVRGTIEIPMGRESFTLTGVADRIEIDTAGVATILDYKTGGVATEKQVRTGFAPQLTLEAAMLRRGGFAAIPGVSSVAGIAYVQLRGGEPPGRECLIAFKDSAPDAEADKALARLEQLVAAFADERTPYRSMVHPLWTKRYGDYDHLARVREWSATGGVEEPGGPQ